MALLGWCRHGAFGWVLTAAAVLAWDLTAKDGEMMSERFRAGVHRHPASAGVIALTWGMLTLHLFGALPRCLDPFRLICLMRRARPGHVHIPCRSGAQQCALLETAN